MKRQPGSAKDLYHKVAQAMRSEGLDPEDEWSWHMLDQIASEYLFQQKLQREIEATEIILKGDKKS